MEGHLPNNPDKPLQLVKLQIILKTTVGVLEAIMGGTMDKASSGACQGGLAATTAGRLGSLVAALVIQVVLLLKRL